MMIGTEQIHSGTVPRFGLLFDVILYGEEPNVMFIFILMDAVQYSSMFHAYEIVSSHKFLCVHTILSIPF